MFYLVVWLGVSIAFGGVLTMVILQMEPNEYVSWTDLVNMPHTVALAVAGYATLLTCVLTMIQIAAHLNSYSHPRTQKLIIRIIWMAPVYSITSLISLMFLHVSLYLDFVRVCYEAYAIYNFLLLLSKYLGGAHGVVRSLESQSELRWPFPLCFLASSTPSPTNSLLYFKKIKWGALQYAIIAPLASVAAIVLNLNNDYGRSFVLTTGYVYITFVINCSQVIALYCLVTFYQLTSSSLSPFSPIPKFLAIKLVVFATFWQGVLLGALANYGILHDTTNYEVGEVENGVQDLSVCVEMLVAAICHKFVFGHEPFQDRSHTNLILERERREETATPALVPALLQFNNDGICAQVQHIEHSHDASQSE